MAFEKIVNTQIEEEVYRIKHESGLTVCVIPKKGFHSAYAIIGTNFGSINSEFTHDHQKIKVPDGTAHYLEHKLFESEDGDAFSKYAKTGASANAFTSFDKTCYLFSCTENFEESLKILLELVQSPYFTKETVAKEQGIISQEIKMYEDSADWKVMMNLLQAMYQNHPIRIDIAGSVESIAEITPEVLYECYHSYYNINKMVFCVAGNVDPETVLKIVNENVKAAKPADTESIFPEEPYEVAKKYTEQKMPVAVPLFELGFKEKAGNQLLTVKERMMTNIILEAFAGSSSKMYRELTDQKLVNSTFSAEYMEGPGYRSVIFGGETHSPEEAANFVIESVRKLHETGISEEDFELARKSIYGGMIRSNDNLMALSMGCMSCEFTGAGLFESYEIIKNITLQDINNRLKEQLDPENCSISVIKAID